MEGNWARAWGVQGISAGSVSVALIGASGGGPWGDGGASAISAAVWRMCSWVLAKVPGDMGGGSAYCATAKGTGAEGAEGSATRFFLCFAKQKQPPNV